MNRPTFLPADLRRRAEAQMALGDLPSKVNLDPIRLLHELEVYKIELELQNEELISANHELDLLRGRYEVLFRHAPVGYLTLSGNGVAEEANDRVCEMLNRDLDLVLRQPFRECLAPESVEAFDTMIAAARVDGNDACADNLLINRPHAVPIYARAQCRLVKVDPHQPPVILLTLMDTTKLKYVVDDMVGSILRR